MKLYGALPSPYVARVVMFARIKGMDLPPTEVPGGSPGSDEYRALTPIAKIPILETDGGIIAESEVICEYLEDIQPEPSGFPADPVARAQSRMISRMTDLYIAPHNSPLMRQQNPATRDAAVVENAANEFAKGFGYVSHFMSDGPFAAGDTPSLGDCALGPFVVLLKRTVFSVFQEIPDPTDSGGSLDAWWTAMQDNDLCSQSLAAYDDALESFLKWLMKRIHGEA